jgi:hypothetical protein
VPEYFFEKTEKTLALFLASSKKEVKGNKALNFKRRKRK